MRILCAAGAACLAACAGSKPPSPRVWAATTTYPTTVPHTAPPAMTPPAPLQPPPAPATVPPPAPFRPRSRPPEIQAAAYILLDARTGRTLASRNADQVRPVASTQKLVTALVVCDAGNLDKPVCIEQSDTRCEPTKLYLRPGERHTRRQLLYAFLVKSGNDGALALARDNAGSIGAFAARMTAKAHALGAHSSRFANPHGLTAPGNYSTARDMGRVAMAAYRNPVIRDAVRRRYFSFRGRQYENTNDLLQKMAECNGMKTGYTNAAGKCLISSARRGNNNVILVQLGSRVKYIWEDGRVMMDWGLDNL